MLLHNYLLYDCMLLGLMLRLATFEVWIWFDFEIIFKFGKCLQIEKRFLYPKPAMDHFFISPQISPADLFLFFIKLTRPTPLLSSACSPHGPVPAHLISSITGVSLTLIQLCDRVNPVGLAQPEYQFFGIEISPFQILSTESSLNQIGDRIESYSLLCTYGTRKPYK
jgi:hypothetical protein